MLNIRSRILFGFCTLLLPLLACNRGGDNPSTPQLTFVRATPAVFDRSNKDTAFLVCTFRDGDGDIGPIDNKDTTINVFAVDHRSAGSELLLEYRLPYITPPGKNKAISGEFELRIPLLTIRPGQASDTATFDISIADRAGHRSNTVTTTPIVIVP